MIVSLVGTFCTWEILLSRTLIFYRGSDDGNIDRAFSLFMLY